MDIRGKFQMVATYENDLSNGSRFEGDGSTVVSMGGSASLPPARSDRETALRRLERTVDPLLFDHEQDPEGRKDVAEEYPDVVDRLTSHLSRH